MTEPTTAAGVARELAGGGLFHWTLHDDRIDFRSDSYGLRTPSGCVWIDPLPLELAATRALGPVAAICLTAGQHQRSAWRYRREFGAPVYAPRGAELDELPDRWVGDGQWLPGGLRALAAPASHASDVVLVAEADGAVTALFCGDAAMRRGDGPLELLGADHADDLAALHRTVRRLIALAPGMVCPAHGGPWLSGGSRALAAALWRAEGGA